MYRQHVQYLLNFAFEDVFPEKKWVRISILIICLFKRVSNTSPDPHSFLSSPWNFDLLFELNSSPIEPEGIISTPPFPSNYHCIIVFTFCLKLFFLAGKSWRPFSCEFSRTNVTFSEFRPFDCKKIYDSTIKAERAKYQTNYFSDSEDAKIGQSASPRMHPLSLKEGEGEEMKNRCVVFSLRLTVVMEVQHGRFPIISKQAL